MTVPFFHVTLEGTNISSWIQSVSLLESDQQADRALLTLNDPYMIYGEAIQEGGKIVIDMGYLPEEHSILMCGIITGVAYHYSQKSTAQLTLTVYDESILAAHEAIQKVWTFPEVFTLEQLIYKIALSESWRIGKVKVPSISLERPLIQHQQSNLAFLLDLAKQYGCRCFLEYDQEIPLFYFVLEEKLMSQTQQKQKLVYQKNLLELNASFHIRQLPRKYEVRTQDPSSGNWIEKTEEPEPPEDWTLNVGSQAFQQFLQESPLDALKVQKLFLVGQMRRQMYLQKLQSKPRYKTELPRLKESQIELYLEKQETRISGMTAQGRCLGSIWIRPKGTIEIQGISLRFSGDWYIKEVTHSINEQGYFCSFEGER
jgi:phage protein D